MSFSDPWALVVGAFVVLALVWLYRRLAARASNDALVYSDVAFFAHATQPRRWVPRAIRGALLLGIVLLAASLAGPKMLFPMPVRDGDVFICIDTSGSMQSTDVSPTREEAAKAAARAFIEALPSGVKVGIITFSSEAGTVQPLTADHAQAVSALDDVPEPNGATAIGDALQLAAQQMPDSGHRLVVLVTDGVNNAGVDPQQMAQYLGAHHIPVYTVGIGTPNGDVIPGTGEEASIDEGALRGYADASGGAYSRAEDASQLHDALSRLGRMTSIETKPVEAAFGFALAGGGILALVVVIAMGLGRFP
jgi:Ca-activated chloride channel family protein